MHVRGGPGGGVRGISTTMVVFGGDGERHECMTLRILMDIDGGVGGLLWDGSELVEIRQANLIESRGLACRGCHPCGGFESPKADEAW